MPTATVRFGAAVETRPTFKFPAFLLDDSEATAATLLPPGDGNSASCRLTDPDLDIDPSAEISNVLLRLPCRWFGAAPNGNTARVFFRPSAAVPWGLVDSHVYLSEGDFTLLADVTEHLDSLPWDAPQVEILCDEGSPFPPIFPEE